MAKAKYLATIVALLLAIFVGAKEPPNLDSGSLNGTNKRLKSRCENASSQVDLQVNNVRARIMNGGDMWWDLANAARYEIPRVPDGSDEPRRHSLFAGSIWIGGLENGNVIAAAQTYRGAGNDFWPGPLDTNLASLKKADCDYWDKVFQVTKTEIDDFLKEFEESGGKTDVPQNIRQWPGNGRAGTREDRFMAPYVDVGGGPGYDPAAGDYPDIRGDQAVWYVYNDMGNLKTETGSPGIGLEMRTMAFAFASSDEINNMTFYETTIYNRGKRQLDKTYFGQWVDADLGSYDDDYVGCDTVRGLGICYNADNFDDGIAGYGANPPSVGVDFFKGPLADLEIAFNAGKGDGIDNDGDGEIDETDTTYYQELRALGYEKMPLIYEGDGVDNNRNGLIDEPEEDITMSKFVYYNNRFTTNGNVRRGTVTDYYGYLTGKWKNGDCLKYGGDGFSTSSDKCANFMFPSDPRDPDGWSEVTANNEAGDRRFLQSAGPFTLKPGAVNKVTIGVVWARASSGGNTGSYDLLLLADDKAQKLFNNDFQLLDGPNAPDITTVELDKEVLIMLQRDDYIETEGYEESEVGINGESIPYSFQGYQLFQLANSQVTADQLLNPDFAREVWQVDTRDEMDKLVNREYDSEVDEYLPQVMVDGANEGVSHSIQLNTDAFASGNAKMVNHRTYHYMLLAYASVGPEHTSEYRQYLSGRRVQKFAVTPSKTEMLFDGVELRARYGDGPEITRLEGLGNGGMVLDLSDETVDTILTKGFDFTPTYKSAKGPVEVKVIDPLKVPVADFELRFIDSNILNTDGEYLFSSVTPQKVIVQDLKSKIEIRRVDIGFLNDTMAQVLNQIRVLKEERKEFLTLLKEGTLSEEDSISYAVLAEYKNSQILEIQYDSTVLKQKILKEESKLANQDSKLSTEEQKLNNQLKKASAVIWELTKINKDGTRQVLRAEKGMIDDNEMVIDEWGLSIKVGPEYGPGDLDDDPDNGYLESELEYEDDANEWLSAMPHTENTNPDIPFIFDWIRVGNYFGENGIADEGFHDAKFTSFGTDHSGILDKNAAFKKGNQLIAPYMLTSRSAEENGFSTYGLCQASNYGGECRNFLILPGIDLVFTSDRSKWSKVLVVEMGEDPTFTEGNVEKFHVRDHASLERDPDAEGNPVYSSTSKGFSWFPGYAVDVETGQRLNIIIGENSSLKSKNTRDMMWNPNDVLTDPDIPTIINGGAVVGGMHFIYVMGASSLHNPAGIEDVTRYDGCAKYEQFLSTDGSQYGRLNFSDVWSDCMWVMPAMLESGYKLTSWANGLIPTTTKLKARVNKAYQTKAPSQGLARNAHLPMFSFNTSNITPRFEKEVATNALNDIRAVPNPYYAQSRYEKTQLDNFVKLTNLPRKCAIKIYTVNGLLVKSFNKDETDDTHNRELIWDLKNEAEVPVASGAYVVHIDAEEIGSQTLKVMLVMKPVDLDTF